MVRIKALQKAFHYIALVVMILIIIFALIYVYYAIYMQELENIEMPRSEQSKGAAHPLPDFIVDKINPDELGQLKP